MAEVDLRKIWESSSSEVLLNPRWTHEEREALEAMAARFAQRDPHLWIASSGSSQTTNTSVKLIALSKKAFLKAAAAANKHVQASDKDMWAQVLPHFHVGGLAIEARAYLTKSKVVSGLKDGQWDPIYFVKVLEQEKVTLTSLVPTQVYDLVQLKTPAPKSIRAVIVGGAALAEDLYQGALDLGWPLLPSYGMTECCSQIATARIENLAKRDRSLYVLSHLQVAISDLGFIKIRGDSLLTGYAQKSAGKEKFIEPQDQGWLVTADKGEYADGVLKPLGRDGDQIKVLGEGVSLTNLDQVLESCLADLKVKSPQSFALVAVPDERAGHRIVLLIEDRDQEVGAKLILDLIRAFDGKVKPYEKIKEHHFVTEIPRTSLGKIQREKLLANFLKK